MYVRIQLGYRNISRVSEEKLKSTANEKATKIFLNEGSVLCAWAEILQY